MQAGIHIPKATPIRSNCPAIDPTLTDCDYEAGDERITITPLSRIPKIRLLSGSIGPLPPHEPYDVPLWLAVQLLKRNKAQIRAPAWLNTESLQDILQTERSTPQLVPIPRHFFEIAMRLFHVAETSIPDAVAVISLVNQVASVRESKLDSLLPTEYRPLMICDNITDYEIQPVRSQMSIFSSSLAMLSKKKDEVDMDT